MRPHTLVATLALCAALPLAAAAEKVSAVKAPTHEDGAGELRLAVGLVPVYEVSEDASGASGSTTYEWEDDDNTAAGLLVQYVKPLAHSPQPGKPLLWGLEVLVSSATVQPEQYQVGGTTFGNNDGEKFSYVALTTSAVLGWRFAQPSSRGLSVLGELQAHAGPTLLSGEVVNGLGSDRSLGYGFDTGARVVFGLHERGWTGTVMAGFRRGWAGLDMDQGNYTSELTLDRIGAEVLVSVGYLF